MATPKASAPSVSYRHNVPKGQHEIGVTIGGVFVSFVAHPDGYFDQLVENAKAIAAAAAEAEEEGA